MQAIGTQEQAAPRPRLGMRVDVLTTQAGVIALEASDDHRLRVLAGSPVRGICGVQRLLYTRGDIDILPAGFADVWEEEDAN
ncbi:MAG TPA: AraC family transcriptional regulator, partial [Sorangium sp.]|nr:AraC family transcriptional regulator [Sorangium sp.]